MGFVIPGDWQQCASEAIAAFRYIPEDQVLQIAYVQGRKVYDFPCQADLFEQFLAAHSKGRFVQHVLRPHARSLSWSRAPYPWPW
jgi:hypothetical protein